MRPRWVSRTHLNHPAVYWQGKYLKSDSDLEAVRVLKCEGSSVMHGCHAQYRKGCRCDECRGWQQKQSAIRAQRKRVAA